jgi:hypothetical protein
MDNMESKDQKKLLGVSLVVLFGLLIGGWVVARVVFPTGPSEAEQAAQEFRSVLSDTTHGSVKYFV